MAAEQFFSLLTTVGQAQLSNAMALNTSINVVEMAVGDGENGAYYTPTESQTALKNELYRGTLNNKYQHATNANWVVFEFAIPAETDAMTIREAGLFDSNGNMLAIAKLPETYKPALAQGSGKDMLVRFTLQTSNVAQVSLFVDPGTVLATHTKVAQDIESHRQDADPHPNLVTPPATTESLGKVELATVAEAIAGTDTDRAVTPVGLNAAIVQNYDILKKFEMLDGLLNGMQDDGVITVGSKLVDPYADESQIDVAASSDYNHDPATATILNGGSSDPGTWNNSVSGGFSMNNQHAGVRFEMTSSGSIESVRLNKYYAGNPGAHIAHIYDDNDGKPGNLIATADGGSGFGGGVGIKDATFSSAVIPASGYYWVIFEDTAGGSPSENWDEVNNVAGITTCRIADSNAVTDLDIATNAQAASLRIEINVTYTYQMDVISKVLEANQEPTRGYILSLIEPVDAVIYDTDVTASLSKDDGATYESAVVSKIGTDAMGRDIVFGFVDFVAQGDQTMRYRIQTPTSKKIKVHGTTMDGEV